MRVSGQDLIWCVLHQSPSVHFSCLSFVPTTRGIHVDLISNLLLGFSLLPLVSSDFSFARLSGNFRLICFNKTTCHWCVYDNVVPCGDTLRYVFMFELRPCITNMWYVISSLSSCLSRSCSALSGSASVLATWHDSGHIVMLCLRLKISVKRCFLSFFSAQAGTHTISHVWWSVYEYSVHEYLCDDVCICIFVCVILMMLSPSTLLGCQHGAGECHTHRPPSKSCWDRSFFSVRTDDSRWHQIDPGHVGLIILCLHVSAPCSSTSRHVQEAWAQNL